MKDVRAVVGCRVGFYSNLEGNDSHFFVDEVVPFYLNEVYCCL